ncbi:unnamed protein product [Thlaspi arvense]|uniref:Uncharacterized protein n=1 Tax=Thlaspi arvense TaxID=13288 RepID=A0AAU9RAE5_THLAR|nr:unnamed protein product [Thlaspi arvense]
MQVKFHHFPGIEHDLERCGCLHAALHWFVCHYVHKLRWQPDSDTFEVDMMTWLATFTPKTMKFSDIRYQDT